MFNYHSVFFGSTLLVRLQISRAFDNLLCYKYWYHHAHAFPRNWKKKLVQNRQIGGPIQLWLAACLPNKDVWIISSRLAWKKCNDALFLLDCFKSYIHLLMFSLKFWSKNICVKIKSMGFMAVIKMCAWKLFEFHFFVDINWNLGDKLTIEQ